MMDMNWRELLTKYEIGHARSRASDRITAEALPESWGDRAFTKCRGTLPTRRRE